MTNASTIIAFLDQHLKRHKTTSLSAVEAASLLDRAGILRDNPQKPGKPLRDILRKGLLPHAYQLGGKGSTWIIPVSQGATCQQISPAAISSPISARAPGTTDLPDDEYERIRASYRPPTIKVLLIGESRPAQGTFFYYGDSSLLSYTRKAFSTVLGREFASASEFLNYFRDAGFFLDDLCLKPVNHMEPQPRKLARKASVSELAARIKAYSPRAIICIMKTIAPLVIDAVDLSGITLEFGFHRVSFPAMSNEQDYRLGLENTLRELRQLGLSIFV